MDVLTTTCPGCARTVAATSGACIYCGAALPAPGAAPPAPPPRPALLCQSHPDVAAVGRCFRCRKGICETCAFKIAVGWACPDCVTAAAQETGKKGKSIAIVSIVLGIRAILTFGLMFIVAAAIQDEKGNEAAASLLLMLSLGLGIAGLSCGFVSKDRSRSMSGVGLTGVIINGVALGLLLLLILAGLFMGN